MSYAAAGSWSARKWMIHRDHGGNPSLGIGFDCQLPVKTLEVPFSNQFPLINGRDPMAEKCRVAYDKQIPLISF